MLTDGANVIFDWLSTWKQHNKYKLIHLLLTLTYSIYISGRGNFCTAQQLKVTLQHKTVFPQTGGADKIYYYHHHHYYYSSSS